MRFTVEAWAPEYGTSTEEAALEEGGTPVDVDIEVPAERWAPLTPPPGVEAPASILFIDGVLRVEARVWVEGGDGREHQGICGSYAAGAVRCDDTARLQDAETRRGLFTSAPDAAAIQTRHGRFEPRGVVGEGLDQLSLGLQQRMRELEVGVAQHAGGAADLIVVDGPLTDRQSVPGAVGYVKTHHAAYLPDAVRDVVAGLEAGQRTPLFLATTKWTRYSWYLRLPGPGGHEWAGVVRCEASADQPTADVVAVADQVSAALPRYASTPHKDSRAPQNLFPIAGLERELRRRLGDPALIWRALRRAAGPPA